MIASFLQEHMAAEKTGRVEGVKANILTELSERRSVQPPRIEGGRCGSNERSRLLFQAPMKPT